MPAKQISFTVNRRDAALIEIAAQRSMSLRVPRDMWSKSDILMDLTATHANGNPLSLPDLIAADDFNFAHDIYGIRRHLDRRTGKLMDLFVPRFSKPVLERWEKRRIAAAKTKRPRAS